MGFSNRDFSVNSILILPSLPGPWFSARSEHVRPSHHGVRLAPADQCQRRHDPEQSTWPTTPIAISPLPPSRQGQLASHSAPADLRRSVLSLLSPLRHAAVLVAPKSV